MEGKNIDQILRTLTSFDGTERIPGRDDTGDFKATVASLVLYATSGGTKKEIDNADETILDTDVYKLYTFDSLTADRDLNLPTLADNNGKEFYVVNLDGSYDINVEPEDRGSGDIDYINDWKYKFPITEKYGMLKITGLSDRWLVKPIGDACIYSSTLGSNNNTTLDGSWDNVDGISITPGYGKFLIDTECNHYVRDDGQLILYSQFGIGITANSTPNIIYGNSYDVQYIGVNGAPGMYAMTGLHKVFNYPYYNNAANTFYMIVQAYSPTLPVVSALVYAGAYIKMRRIY